MTNFCPNFSLCLDWINKNKAFRFTQFVFHLALFSKKKSKRSNVIQGCAFNDFFFRKLSNTRKKIRKQKSSIFICSIQTILHKIAHHDIPLISVIINYKKILKWKIPSPPKFSFPLIKHQKKKNPNHHGDQAFCRHSDETLKTLWCNFWSDKP